MIRRPILNRLVYQPDGCLIYNGALDRGYGKGEPRRCNDPHSSTRLHRGAGVGGALWRKSA